ncbi:hypothetical protein GCM10022227_21280 [Streptomyces sedi]
MQSGARATEPDDKGPHISSMGMRKGAKKRDGRGTGNTRVRIARRRTENGSKRFERGFERVPGDAFDGTREAHRGKHGGDFHSSPRRVSSNANS